MQADAARGLLIVNADDWGRDVETTNRILDCVAPGGVSAVSAMVFMEDSERAAALAREHRIDAGLHLNLTTSFSAKALPGGLLERQRVVSRYLRSHRLAPYLFNPRLTRAFAYLVSAQLDEFRRLYGAEPARIDRICSLARTAVVELETHPAQLSEYQFLRSGDILRSAVRVGPSSALRAES